MLTSSIFAQLRTGALVVVLAGFVAFQPCFGIVTTTSGSGLANDQAPQAETDRFQNDSSFLQAITNSGSFDFTGVGQTPNCSNASGSIGVGICWATMISPTLFLSATHSHPSPGSTVSFHDDAGNPIASRTVVASSSISSAIPNNLSTPTSSDLWIGELSAAVPAGVEQYSIGSPTVGSSDAIQVGVGGAITAGGPQFRVGQNRLDATAVNLDTSGVVGVSDFLLYVDNSVQGSEPTTGTALNPDLPYESRFQGGDSGGPSFVYNGSELELVGIHSFITSLTLFTTELDQSGNPTSTATSVRRGSADVAVASYQTAINAKVAAAVPEPSAGLLLLVLGLIRSSRRYWRDSAEG